MGLQEYDYFGIREFFLCQTKFVSHCGNFFSLRNSLSLNSRWFSKTFSCYWLRFFSPNLDGHLLKTFFNLLRTKVGHTRGFGFCAINVSAFGSGLVLNTE